VPFFTSVEVTPSPNSVRASPEERDDLKRVSGVRDPSCQGEIIPSRKMGWKDDKGPLVVWEENQVGYFDIRVTSKMDV
jgi:hypothetical protein